MVKKPNVTIRVGLLVGVLAAAATAQDRGFVVHLNKNADAPSVAVRHGLTLKKSLRGSGSGLHVMSAPQGAEAWRVIQNLASDPAVKSVEADAPMLLPGQNAAAQVRPASAAPPPWPIDGTLTPYYTGMAAMGYVNQPATNVIKVSDAHKLATGSGTVAVIDTGVDLLQPVLAGSVVSGWDFIHNVPGGQEVVDLNQETTPILDQETTPILDQETTPILDGGSAIILNQETTPILDQETTPILDSKKYPAFGHGTMVSGLIHLVAPNATIMPLRAFAADGTATISQIVAAIYYAVDNGAQVINMSFSTKVPSDSLRAALKYASSQGVICVAAAGNDGQDETVYPGAYNSVIDVASINNSGVRSLFSNFGSEINLAAPGEAVITTYPGHHYAVVWGTSFSTPLVTGGAALMIDPDDKTSSARVRNALTQSAVPIGQELGAGELDVYQAVNYLWKRGGN